MPNRMQPTADDVIGLSREFLVFMGLWLAVAHAVRSAAGDTL